MSSRVVVKGYDLISKQVVTVNLNIPFNQYFLLKGTVYSPNKKPLPHAALQVVKVFRVKKRFCEKKVGVTFTKEDGSYGIVLPKVSSGGYILVAYSLIDS